MQIFPLIFGFYQIRYLECYIHGNERRVLAQIAQNAMFISLIEMGSHSYCYILEVWDISLQLETPQKHHVLSLISACQEHNLIVAETEDHRLVEAVHATAEDMVVRGQAMHNIFDSIQGSLGHFVVQFQPTLSTLYGEFVLQFLTIAFQYNWYLCLPQQFQSIWCCMRSTFLDSRVT